MANKKRTYNKDEINKMILMYQSGISLFKIREILKMDKNNIKKILIENNIWIENRDNKKMISDYNTEEINKIISLYQSGMSSTSISVKLNIIRKVIKKILIQNNVWIEGRDNPKIEFSEKDKNKIFKLHVDENKNSREHCLEVLRAVLFPRKPSIPRLTMNQSQRREPLWVPGGVVVMDKTTAWWISLKIASCNLQARNPAASVLPVVQVFRKCW